MTATIRGVSGEFATGIQQQQQQENQELERQAEDLYNQADRLRLESSQHLNLAQELQQQAQQQGRFKAFFTRRKSKRETRRSNKCDVGACSLEERRMKTLEAAQAAFSRSRQAAAGVQAEQEVVHALSDITGVTDIICGLSFGPALGDIDIIAIGPQTVVLEVKAGHGKVTINSDGQVYHGDKLVPRNPIEQCDKQLRLLREAGLRHPIGLVVFPQAQSEIIRISGSDIIIIAGINNLRQEVQRLMQSTNGADIPTAYQLVYLVDGWLADKSAETNQRLTMAYQYQQQRSDNMRRWQSDLERWRTWNNPAGVQKKKERREQISRAANKFVSEQQNIKRLQEQINKWEEARNSNQRLVI